MDWTHKLRLRNLKLLLSLAQTRNISHSAVMMNTSQPGLSKWLKDLEEDIGLQLFERHARGLFPTPYGEALIAHAQRISTQLDRASGDMAALRASGGRRIVIGAAGEVASDAVSIAIISLLIRMPPVHVKLVEDATERLLAQLAQGDVDIVVGRYAPEHHNPAILSEALSLEPIALLARPQHPLFAQTEVQWADLQAYRWIISPPGTLIRNALDVALDTLSVETPSNAVETNSMTASLTLISESDMIGVYSHCVAQRFIQMHALRTLPIRLPGFGSIAMYWQHETFLPAAVQTMLDCLRQVKTENIA